MVKEIEAKNSFLGSWSSSTKKETLWRSTNLPADYFIENADYNHKNGNEFVFRGPSDTGLVLYLQLPTLISDREPVSLPQENGDLHKISKNSRVFLLVHNHKHLTICAPDLLQDKNETFVIENFLDATYIDQLGLIFIINDSILWKLSRQSEKTLLYNGVLIVQEYIASMKKDKFWKCNGSCLPAYQKIPHLNFKESELYSIYKYSLYEIFYNNLAISVIECKFSKLLAPNV